MIQVCAQRPLWAAVECSGHAGYSRCGCGVGIRHLHSLRKQSTYTPAHPFAQAPPKEEYETEGHMVRAPKMPSSLSPLSILPLSSVLRSIAILSVSSSNVLLRPSLYLMAKVANAQSGLLNTDSNPVLRWLVKRSLYKQFCAGETPQEVRATMDQLRQMGYKGVILGYAKEIVLDKSAASGLGRQEEMLEASERSIEEIESWRKGTLDTVKLAAEGDYVALKFTGAGMQTIQLLKKSLPPSPPLERAINEICELATTRNVRLLFDAEQQAVQPGIDDWTLEYMRRYNNRQPGKAVVYGTYQAYLKVTPKVLAEHLSFARREGFTLGVKLVRGAYLATDPRYLISDTKEDTDRQYDGIVASLIEQKYNAVLTPNETENGNHFPPVNVVLASHNQASIRRAQERRRAQSDRGVKKIDLVYAQLMGMADEVSCELLQAGRVEVEKKASDIPKAYKYLVWGTTGECMKYLLRRAEENRDAVARTRHGRDALAKELWRRLRNMVSLL